MPEALHVADNVQDNAAENDSSSSQVAAAQEHSNSDGVVSEQEVDLVSRFNCVFDCESFSWIWLCGFGLFCLGNVCDFIALGITPLSAVTLLGSWSLVVNPVAAYFLLHEVVTTCDVASIALIIAGIVFTVMSTDHAPNDWPLQRLITHYREPKVIVLLVSMACVIFTSLFVIHVDWTARVRKSHLVGSTGIVRPNKYIRTVYVMVGSVVGNFTALFGKAFSGLLVFTISGQDQFNDPFVAIIIVVFLVSLPLQVYLINASLAVNDILYHMPNFYVFWNVGNLVTGAVFYNEKAHLSETNWVLFLSGVSLLFLGVLCTNISSTRKQEAGAKSWQVVGANHDDQQQKCTQEPAFEAKDVESAQ
jgi:drug/metabolite transporter (DMT)-like permease